MAFIRMIVPAWIAGGYASLFVILLVFYLNPALHLTLLTLVRFFPLGVLISTLLAMLWPLLYRFLRLFARGRLRVRWYRFRYLFGFATANLLWVSALYWYNGNLLRALLPPGASFRLRVASIVLSGCALTLLVVLSVRRLRREQGVRIACYFLVGLLPLTLAAIRTGYRIPAESPYTSELAKPSPNSPRLLVIGIGGATLDQILPLVAQGKLPWLSRLFQRGTHGRLAAFRPCSEPVVWQSLLTGMLPFKHRVLDEKTYLLKGAAGEIRVTPRGIGFRTLARISGFRARDQTAYESPSLTFTQVLSRLGYPIRWLGPGGESPPPKRGSDTEVQLDRFLPSQAPFGPRRDRLEADLRWALSRDLPILKAGLEIWRQGNEKGVLLILPGLDRVSHLFLRFAMPEGYGNVPQEEVERYGSVLERYYRFLDEMLGRFLEVETPGGEETPELRDVLIFVVSPHGIEPLPLTRRVLAGLGGNPHESGYHGRGPDGMILAAGPGIRRDTSLGKASILDLAPTFLYLFGLPIGVDMDGHPMTRLFDDAFVATHPVLLIPSYEASRIGGRGEDWPGPP